MTKEEIKNIPEIVDLVLDESITADARVKLHKRLEEVCDMAIKALEQQPSEDCISREAVLDTIGNVPDYDDGMVWEALSHAQRDVALLPSVTPQRPNGKWIDIEIDAGEFIYKCSKCGMRVINPYKYCPICGAEMGGGEDAD